MTVEPGRRKSARFAPPVPGRGSRSVVATMPPGGLLPAQQSVGAAGRQALAAATATAEGGGQLPAACSTGSAAQWSMIDLYKQHERLPGAKQAGERATLTSQPKPSQLCPLSF